PCLAALLLLLEALERPSVEERPCSPLGERGDVVVGCPRIAISDELPDEPAAPADRAADPTPDVREASGIAEEQAEARLHEVGGRQLDVLHPRDPRLEPGGQVRGDAGAEAVDRLGLRIDRHHAPAATQHRERVDPRPAPEVDRAPGFGVHGEHLEEALTGLAAIVRLVEVVPGRVAHAWVPSLAIPPRRISTNSLIRMFLRSGRRWI